MRQRAGHFADFLEVIDRNGGLALGQCFELGLYALEDWRIDGLGLVVFEVVAEDRNIHRLGHLPSRSSGVVCRGNCALDACLIWGHHIGERFAKLARPNTGKLGASLVDVNVQVVDELGVVASVLLLQRLAEYWVFCSLASKANIRWVAGCLIF